MRKAIDPDPVSGDTVFEDNTRCLPDASSLARQITPRIEKSKKGRQTNDL